MLELVRVVIHGRVQGVGYRAWTQATARALGITGWVRNLRDGTVEAVFQGDASRLERMLDACEKGPAAAQVLKIERFESEEEPYAGFNTRPTV